jgi:xanthine dehydrogenase accessory factor
VLHLATLVRTEGSTYRRPGARTLFVGEGESLETVGLVSGGCIEPDLALRRTYAGPRAELHRYDLDAGEDDLLAFGTGCKGTLEIVLERCDLSSETHALAELERAYSSGKDPGFCLHDLSSERLGERVFCTREEALREARATGGRFELVEELPVRRRVAFVGATPDVIPSLRLTGTLGWERTVVDHRAGWLARLPAELVEHRRAPSHDESLADVTAALEADAVVIMTHHLEADLEALRGLARAPRPPSYVGLLGPSARRDELLALLSREERQRLAIFGPAGLDLGGDGPEAVALSIVAEIHATLHRASAEALRVKKGAIHGRAA